MTLVERNHLSILPPHEAAAHPGVGWDRIEPEETIAFGQLVRVLRRRWKLFAGVLALCLLGALAASLILPVRYAAEARLMVDPRPGSSVSTTNAATQPDASIVDTEVKVVSSPAVFKAVADRLNLAADPEFAASKFSKDPSEAVTDKLARHVAVARQGLTYIVSIWASSHDRQKAARIANALADEYLQQSRLQRAQVAADQARTLTAELGPLGRQVVEADERVAAYRAEHGIVSSGSAQGGTVTDQQVASITAELGKAADAAAAAQSTAAAARTEARNAGVESISQVLNSDSLAELRKQRAQVQRDQAQIATVYGPDHPASVRINEQLAKLNHEIDVAARRVVSGLESDAAAATAREGALRGQLARLQQRQETDSQANAVALGLQRQADAARTIYNDLSRSAQEQAQEARIGESRAYVVSAAEPPAKPSFPKPSLFLMFGLAIGSAAGAAAVALAEGLERGFRSVDQVESVLLLPLLAGVPELPEPAKGGAKRLRGRDRIVSPFDYVLERPVSSFAESIRNIRATLMDGSADAGGRTICVTSALPSEGKSVLAVSLARVMAMSGDRVLLIDCDLRRNGLGKLRPDEARPGLVEVLHGEADPSAALNEDRVEGLTFLGLDGPVYTPKDIFSGPAAKEMLRKLQAEYDFIILDTPPVLAVTDAWTISSLCQATLLVVRHSKTPRNAVSAALERLRMRGARMHGVVLNRLQGDDPEHVGYQYSMYSNYYVN